MDIEDFKTIGFKQMHQMQVDTLIDYVSTTINLAAMLGDEEIMREIEAESDEFIKMFGGNGLHVTVLTGELVVRDIDTKNSGPSQKTTDSKKR